MFILSTVQKNSVASRFRTQIVRLEGKDVDNYTATSASRADTCGWIELQSHRGLSSYLECPPVPDGKGQDPDQSLADCKPALGQVAHQGLSFVANQLNAKAKCDQEGSLGTWNQDRMVYKIV